MIRRRVLIVAALVLLVAIGLPAILLYYLTQTESGLRWAVSQVPERVGRAQLSIGTVSGTLADGITLTHFEVEHERVRVRFEGITGRIELLPLLVQTVSVPELAARDATIEVRRRTSPASGTWTPRFLPRTLRIDADRIDVAHALLIAPNGRRLEGTALSASGVARHKTIRFYDASVIWNEARIAATGEVRAAAPVQLTADARIDLRRTEQPAWVIEARGDGDLDALAINAHFAEPFRADFEGRALELTRGWRWNGSAQVHDFDLQAWDAGDALGQITGTLELSGDRDGFTARGPLTPQGLEAGAFDAFFDGTYAERIVQARRIEVTHRESQAHATGSGQIEVVQDGPRLALRGTWRDFRWPLVGADPSVRSAAGEYTLTGVWPYTLTATGELAPGPLPPMKFDVAGALAKRSLTLERAEAEPLGGTASLTGVVEWGPDERWSLAGQARGVDPGLIREDLPGKVDVRFDASGDGFGEAGNFRVVLRNLGGRLRGVRARGGGTVGRRDGTWEFSDMRVSLGRTRVLADGSVGERLDLRFAVEAESLRLLHPGSRGHLTARGTVRGTVENPVVDVVATGNDIEHDGIRLGAFTADVDFDAARDALAHVALRGTKLQFDGRTIERLRFDLDGAASKHEVRIGVRAPGLNAAARATGSFARGVWNGRLGELTLRGEETLDLSLENPVDVRLARDLARLDFVCVHGTPARICAEADWTPAKWTATFTTTELPLSTLTAGLTPSLEYRGTVNVVARGYGGGGEPVQGNLRADLIDAQLLRRTATGREDTITFGSGLVLAAATRDAIEAQMSFDAHQIGTITGELVARRSSEDWSELPLRGVLRAQTGELDLVSLYVPQVDRAAGRLEANLRLAGTLGAPLLSGLIRIEDAEFDFYQVNLAMRQVGLEARLASNTLDFSASAHMGEGTVKSSGRLEWRDSLPYGQLRLTGERLQVANIPEAVVYATPDLTFQVEGRRIAVTGEVHVPEASFVPVDVTDAVLASGDEVIVSEGEPEDDGPAFEVVSNIRLTLGDQVHIDTYGLTGDLTGSITARTSVDEIARATGELRIEEGEYTAYGRRLDIERGRLVFTGGAVQDPGVDIRAVKQYPDVKAGVIVRGTLREPRMTFFSEPMLTQSQIVSLILAGGSLADVQNEPGSTRSSSASNELLAQGGAILAQQLGSRVGLEDVSIESNLANETSLVLGKYLSPRFYVSYGISLTEALNTLKLRYSLSDHWTVRSELGEERSADLVYTIEK